MEATYEEFPEDEIRTRRIYELLKAGGSVNPAYIEDGDKSLFVMEGRHRIVAFLWLGMTEINICFCKPKPH